MPSEQELASFIRSTFRSVWTLELLIFLRSNPERGWDRAELVQRLRASDSIVSSGADALLAAGLIIDENGFARYRPVSADTDALAAATETLYAGRPDAVRRLIVGSATDGVAAFADAFRLRRD